jgi:hypothetical protein
MQVDIYLYKGIIPTKKEVKKMKRLLALLLVLVMCLSLCACGGSGSKKKETVESKVISAARSRIMVEIALGYDTTGVPTITTFVEKTGDNTYMVTGKVTVKDNYGDTYTGKYDAEVTYDPVADDCDVDLELGKLYKD